MNDLISRQAAINRIKKQIEVSGQDRPLMISKEMRDNWNENAKRAKAHYELAIEMLERLPAADVKPLIKGKWVLDPDGIDWGIPAWKCSICGCRNHNIGVVDKGFGSNPFTWAGSKYCPNCGAKMDSWVK